MAEALATAVADGDTDADAVGVGDGAGVGGGVGLVLGEAVVDGVGVAGGTQKLGAGVGASRVRFVGEVALPPPASRRAAGTTSRPMMTVTTKASAPHSCSQKVRDELRIRALRPSPVAVCCGY